MRYLILILLAGCATDFQPEKYEPTCARQCFIAQSSCAARASGIVGQEACDNSTRNCLRTCPAR